MSQPRLTVLMFTDIVGSADLKSSLGDADYVEYVARPHNRLFRQMLARFPTADESNYTGDGFLATFDSVADAVNAALLFHHELRNYDWQSATPETRIGIHLGDTLQLSGRDAEHHALASHATDMCARLMGLAQGGQTLLTRAAYDSAVQYVRQHPKPEDGSQPPPVEWISHGRYVFKGRNEPMEVFEVGAVGSAPLQAPGDSEKARQATSLAHEATQVHRPGQTLGDYELLEEIGRGGMGVVFKARHRRLDKAVALKLLSPQLMQDPDSVQRFEREMKALGRLDHPNLVDASDARDVNGQQFLVMRYIAGRDLRSHVREYGPLPVGAACEVIRQAATGLHNAHQAGLIHRDVKPANLMLTPEGVVKVLDLGLAALRKDHADEPLTTAGRVMGTADYMAPEQFEDSAGVDARADIYGLGCTLFFLLTGQPPFCGPKRLTYGAKAAAHLHEAFPTLGDSGVTAPPSLSHLLDQMVTKDSGARFANCAELVDELEPLASGAETLTALCMSSTDRWPTPSTTASPQLEQHRRTARDQFSLQGKSGSIGCGLIVSLALLVSVGLYFSQPARVTFDNITSIIPNQATDEYPIDAMAVDVADVEVLSLTIEHLEFDGSIDTPRGRLGVESFHVRPGDAVRLEASLSAHSYCYLIAFRPDGVEELIFPEPVHAGEPPPATDRPGYPSVNLDHTYGLTDGAGLQTFVLVVSDTRLPPYAEWREGLPDSPWQESLVETNELDDIVWQHDGERLRALTPSNPLGTRAAGRQIQRPAGEMTAALIDWLQPARGVDAIEAWSFVVPPESE